MSKESSPTFDKAEETSKPATTLESPSSEPEFESQPESKSEFSPPPASAQPHQAEEDEDDYEGGLC